MILIPLMAFLSKVMVFFLSLSESFDLKYISFLFSFKGHEISCCDPNAAHLEA